MQGCKGCDLYLHATQAVCGEGKKGSVIAMVGEQPGNEEDRKGAPFVGPAGRLLDRALVEAGIDRSEVFVTNAVKHFKFEERGKRRIHKKPSVAEVRACKAWLEAEIEVVSPRVLVCLGSTAAQSVMGTKFRLMEERGKAFPHAWGPEVVATVHPSSILRIPEGREEAYAAFLADLKVVKKLAAA
jgi:DNA polymerase